jgi:hypothetical protein
MKCHSGNELPPEILISHFIPGLLFLHQLKITGIDGLYLDAIDRRTGEEIFQLARVSDGLEDRILLN